MEPLVKVAQYGNIFEVIRFEKPLIRSGPSRFFIRRKRSKDTLKLTQNIWRTKRRIRRFVSVVSERMGPPAFATFTYATPQHDMESSIADWRLFTMRMKKAFPSVAFIRVPERHKSGAVHFHAAVFGLPSNLPCDMKKMGNRWIHACASDRACERRLRSLAKVWGKGFVDLQNTRNPERLGAYLAKYLTKGDPDWSLFGLHVASCNRVMHEKINSARQAGTYWELSSYRQSVAVDWALEIMASRGAEMRQKREFETKWLGRARFELYTVPPS